MISLYLKKSLLLNITKTIDSAILNQSSVMLRIQLERLVAIAGCMQTYLYNLSSVSMIYQLRDLHRGSVTLPTNSSTFRMVPL